MLFVSVFGNLVISFKVPVQLSLGNSETVKQADDFVPAQEPVGLDAGIVGFEGNGQPGVFDEMGPAGPVPDADDLIATDLLYIQNELENLIF